MQSTNFWLFYIMYMVRYATKLGEATARIAGATFLDLYMALNQAQTEISLAPLGPPIRMSVKTLI